MFKTAILSFKEIMTLADRQWLLAHGGLLSVAQKGIGLRWLVNKFQMTGLWGLQNNLFGTTFCVSAEVRKSRQINDSSFNYSWGVT